MNEVDIKAMLEKAGLKVFYNHAKEGTKVPYITYTTTTDNIFADDSILEKRLVLEINLYEAYRDLKIEKKLEDVLNAHKIPWNRDESYDSESKVFIEIYETEVI